MGQLLIRQVDDADILALKAQAERANISLEQRLRNLVSEAVGRERDAFWELARISREMTGGQTMDVESVLRESRRELLDRDPVSRR